MSELVDTPIIDANANNYVNDPNIEFHWAMKAFQHAEIHFNLLCAIDSKLLKLTKIDDLIYSDFRQIFRDLKVEKIDVDHLKSNESKELWRPFCESYKEKVEDYNMGTLLRIDPNGDYNEENTTLVPRIQFYAIEIARNREGHNINMYELKTDVTDFEQRSKSVFDSLISIESYHKTKETEYLDQDEEIEEIVEDEFKIVCQSENIQTSNSNDFQFKVPNINVYKNVNKRKLENDVFKSAAKHHKKEPDFVTNPNKWKKYSLEDVDESQMNQSANYKAAMSFLNKSEKSQNEEFLRLADTVVFNKPIGNNKKISDSNFSYEKIGKNLLENLNEYADEEINEDMDKMEIDNEQYNASMFKRSSKKKNVRKKNVEENDNEKIEYLTSINKNENLMVYNESNDSNEAFDEFKNEHNSENENEIGLDLDKY